MIQIIFAIVLLVIIFIFSFVFYKINTIKKVTKKKEKEEEIEILDVDDNNYSDVSKQALKEVSQDTLNLDDLFKTMSINVIKDDPSFDFDLLRKNK